MAYLPGQPDIPTKVDALTDANGDPLDAEFQPSEAFTTPWTTAVETAVESIAEEVLDGRERVPLFVYWDGVTGSQPARSSVTDDPNRLVFWCQPVEPPAVSGLNVWFRTPAA